MSTKSTRFPAAPALMMLGATLAGANWLLQPERAWAWAVTIGLIGGMSLVLWFASRGTSDVARRAGDTLRSGVVLAGLILVISLAAKLAAGLGLVADAGLWRRATMVVVGGFFVVIGNRMPKMLTPLAALQCDGARVQAFQRFAGWTWVLTGLAFAIAWLLLPLDLAESASTAVLLIGMLITATQIVRLRITRRRAV